MILPVATNLPDLCGLIQADDPFFSFGIDSLCE